MSPVVAGLTVFYTSGAVLVLEILALRLLAPYVGVTLETYTATIATVLAGISAGTWVGGYAADRVEPRRLLGPLLVSGGGLSLLAVPLVRALGSAGAKKPTSDRPTTDDAPADPKARTSGTASSDSPPPATSSGPSSRRGSTRSAA